VDIDVLLGNWVGADDDRQTKGRFDESLEAPDIRAGRIADDEAGCQVDDRGAVLLELLGNKLDVAAGATAAAGSADDFHRLGGGIAGERPSPFPQRPKALPGTAIVVPGADDDSYFCHWGILSDPSSGR